MALHQISVVPLLAEHLPRIAELEKICFAEPWSEASLRILLAFPGFGAVAVTETGEAAGYVGVLCAADEGQITNVAVFPEYRRCGVATEMLTYLKEDCRARGLLSVSLEVRASHAGTVALYRSVGFSEVGKRPNFYRKPTEDALLMECKL